MTRKLFSLLLAGVASVAMLAGPTSKASAASRELKFSSYVSEHHWLTSHVFQPFMDDVAKLTNGEVTVKLFASGVLGGAKEQLSLAESGVADITFIIPSYTRNRFPYVEAGLLPFAFENSDQGTQVLQAMRAKYINDEFKTVKLLFVGTTSPGAMVTTKPVKTLADMKGMNLRGSGGAQTAVLKDVGANVVSMPVSDAYLAFQRGALEGTIIPLASAPGYKFQEVIKYVNRINFSVTPLALGINKTVWASLSKSQQDAIQKAADTAADNLGKGYVNEDENGLKTMLDAGATVTKLSAADKKHLQDVAKPLWQEWVDAAKKKGLPADQYMADFKAAIDKYAPK